MQILVTSARVMPLVRSCWIKLRGRMNAAIAGPSPFFHCSITTKHNQSSYIFTMPSKSRIFWQMQTWKVRFLFQCWESSVFLAHKFHHSRLTEFSKVGSWATNPFPLRPQKPNKQTKITIPSSYHPIQATKPAQRICQSSHAEQNTRAAMDSAVKHLANGRKIKCQWLWKDPSLLVWSSNRFTVAWFLTSNRVTRWNCNFLGFQAL